MTADALFRDTRQVEVNGTALAYCEQGEGEPVVFVHGGLADLRVWRRQMPVIGESYRAIAYSQRYCRPNDAIDSGAANPFGTHIDDLAEFIERIGAEPAHVVGSSSGAFITLLAAIRYPERFLSLVLAEAPVLSLFVSTPPRAIELLKLFATRPRTGMAILRFALGTINPTTRAFRAGDDEQAMQIFLRGVLGEWSLSQLPDESVQVLRDNISTLRGGLLYDEVGFPRFSTTDLRNVDIPVLLVTGNRSPAFFSNMTDRLEERLPDVERVEIPDASHVMFEENASAFNEKVLAFLRAHGRGVT